MTLCFEVLYLVEYSLVATLSLDDLPNANENPNQTTDDEAEI